MPHRVVLIPFPRANSAEHLLSTHGYEGYCQLYGDMGKDYEKLLTEHHNAHDGTLGSQQDDESTFIGRLIGYQLPVPEKPPTHQFKEVNYLKKAGKQLRRQKREMDDFFGDLPKLVEIPGWKNTNYQNVVCADDPRLDMVLKQLTDKSDRLYVRGHCNAGSQTLGSADKSVDITVEKLVEILEGKLVKHFPGYIIVYGCKSAVHGDTRNSQSFAERFAEELHANKWLQCRVFGYKEDMKQFAKDTGHRVTDAGVEAKKARMEIPRPGSRDKCSIM